MVTVNKNMNFLSTSLSRIFRKVASLWVTRSLIHSLTHCSYLQGVTTLRPENTEPVSTVLYASSMLALPSLLTPTQFLFTSWYPNPPTHPSSKSTNIKDTRHYCALRLWLMAHPFLPLQPSFSPHLLISPLLYWSPPLCYPQLVPLISFIL